MAASTPATLRSVQISFNVNRHTENTSHKLFLRTGRAGVNRKAEGSHARSPEKTGIGPQLGLLIGTFCSTFCSPNALSQMRVILALAIAFCQATFPTGWGMMSPAAPAAAAPASAAMRLNQLTVFAPYDPAPTSVSERLS